LAQNGVTIFLSTPYMDEAERCQSIGLIQKGELLRVSEPKTLAAELPFEVLELTSKDLDKVQNSLEPLPEIGSCRIVGDRMRIQTAALKPAEKAIEKALVSSGLGDFHLRQVHKTMEDVFLHITGDSHEH